MATGIIMTKSPRRQAMTYRYALAVVLLFGLGCAADEQGQWDEFWKDVSGDNMKMRYDGWRKEETAGQSARTRSVPSP
jgi:hypothetical protein